MRWTRGALSSSVFVLIMLRSKLMAGRSSISSSAHLVRQLAVANRDRLALTSSLAETIYQPHGFNQQDVGLAFVGILVGVTIAALSQPLWLADSRRLMRKHGVSSAGELGPEVHLRKGMAGAVCLTLGLVWFAATLDPAIHWIVSILGTVVFGCGVGRASGSLLGADPDEAQSATHPASHSSSLRFGPSLPRAWAC